MKKLLNITETFGSYIRRLRIKNNIGQRELAKKIGIKLNKSQRYFIIIF